MTGFLVRRFVKDRDNVEDIRVRTAYGTLTNMVGIGCGLLLFISKLRIGTLVHDISAMADAFNSLSDAASSITGFVGVKTAEKPAGDDHPFGHGRIEYVAAFIVTLPVIRVGFFLLKASFGKVLHPEDISFRWISILILLMSVAIRLWLSCFNKKLGKRINSRVMLATSTNVLGDVVTTSATVCSIGIYGAFGFSMDGIVGLIVSVVVMIAGVNIAKDTLTPLIGEVIDPGIYDKILSFVENFDGIAGSHDLTVRNYGPSRSMASIHAEVPNDYDMERTHEIIDRIEQETIRRMGILLVIHMDPVETHDERVVEFKELVTSILDGIDSRLTFRDFKMVNDVERINLIFNLAVPREYKPSVLDKPKARITEDVAKKDRRCCYVVTMENSFIPGSRE